MLFREIQEGLLYVLGPIIYWWFVFIGVGGVLSAIGVVIMENFPQIDSLD